MTGPGSPASSRSLVLVVGAGRSGTSLMAGVLGALGFQVPQPEVEADDTNPRGFSEPRWVVDFHTRLMRPRRISNLDSRPAAVELAAQTVGEPAALETLRSWLEVQFVGAQRVVVKDPRTAWFLPLWQRCAAELGVKLGIVTMLRHPVEVVLSARASYPSGQQDASWACGWVNVMLETERATRDLPRVFVRYPDLLADWRSQTQRIGTALGLPSLTSPEPAATAAVDVFVDPTLRRRAGGWEDLSVPDQVRVLADDVVAALDTHVETGSDDAADLDELTGRYRALYADAEAIAQSSIRAATPRPSPRRARGGEPDSSARRRDGRPRTSSTSRTASADARGKRGARQTPKRSSGTRLARVARRVRRRLRRAVGG